MSVRIQRVEELLKRELSELIRRALPVAEAGLLNINRLKVSRDLQLATVFIGVLGTADQKKNALALLLQHRKELQRQLGRSVVLRHTPTLKFLIDESVEKGNRVLEILEELDKPSPPQ